MSESWTYIGRKPCGCVVAAAVDNPEYVQRTAHTVAQFVKDGLAVERVTTEVARELLRICPHQPKKPRRPKPAVQERLL